MDKIYYSISEVSEMLQLSQSNLRFWEKEFKQLKPQRNNKGTRFYSNDDIATIKKIMFLVEDQKLTLDGAKKRLGQRRDAVEKQQIISEKLKNIREELKGIAKALDI
ncbi:MAG: MerR family transcriptional regulator [Paludibacter sp.]|nr:MerR family transcriptional regulator [Paludibacter sp.]